MAGTSTKIENERLQREYARLVIFVRISFESTAIAIRKFNTKKFAIESIEATYAQNISLHTAHWVVRMKVVSSI